MRTIFWGLGYYDGRTWYLLLKSDACSDQTHTLSMDVRLFGTRERAEGHRFLLAAKHQSLTPDTKPRSVIMADKLSVVRVRRGRSFCRVIKAAHESDR